MDGYIPLLIEFEIVRWQPGSSYCFIYRHRHKYSEGSLATALKVPQDRMDAYAVQFGTYRYISGVEVMMPWNAWLQQGYSSVDRLRRQQCNECVEFIGLRLP